MSVFYFCVSFCHCEVNTFGNTYHHVYTFIIIIILCLLMIGLFDAQCNAQNSMLLIILLVLHVLR
jgi:hypothetical protein